MFQAKFVEKIKTTYIVFKTIF